MGLRKSTKRSPAEEDLLFEYDPEPVEEVLTAYAGIPLFVRAARSLGVGTSVKRHVRVKQRERGLDEAAYVESFLVLNALGGDCLDDFARLREDAGLETMLGYAVPSPEAARKFLYAFHEEAKIEEAKAKIPAGQMSFIPEENDALAGLGEVNRELVGEIGRRTPSERIATVDLDATVIESHKREAQPTYQGRPGYQPMLALWAEMDLVVADEFRDGNVPAQASPRQVAERAFRCLPETVKEYYFRGDSACWDWDLINWLRDEKREGGVQGAITFAVSVRMTAKLKERIERLGEKDWQPYREDAEVVSECAEIWNHWPEDRERPEGAEALRYVAIRVKRRQGELFGDGATVKHFAVATNQREWAAKRLLEWHREKAGSIEALHDVLKNELAAGVLPCGRFGANAAWLRLAAMTHNVLTGLKRIALAESWLRARPKRMRFRMFCSPGRIVSHARRVLLRVAREARQLAAWVEAWKLLPAPG